MRDPLLIFCFNRPPLGNVRRDLVGELHHRGISLLGTSRCGSSYRSCPSSDRGSSLPRIFPAIPCPSTIQARRLFLHLLLLLFPADGQKWVGEFFVKGEEEFHALALITKASACLGAKRFRAFFSAALRCRAVSFFSASVALRLSWIHLAIWRAERT